MAEEPGSTSAAKWEKSTELTNFSGTFVLSLFSGQLNELAFFCALDMARSALTGAVLVVLAEVSRRL